MTTDHAGYFGELAAALGAAGVPADRIDATVSELAAHLAETGSTPEEEFGPAAAFAARLGGTTPDVTGPADEAETWTWTADVYNDRRLLALHGDQGWEVERLDALGRFVCRRTSGTALRWEYRREIVGERRREGLLDRLEPDGWELCGEWFFYAYFKRPKAASTGPAAALTALPQRPARSWYIGTRAWLLAVGWPVAVALILMAYVTDRLGFAVTFPALLAGAVGMALWTRRQLTKGAGNAV
jgi:hypothetical protein